MDINFVTLGSITSSPRTKACPVGEAASDQTQAEEGAYEDAGGEGEDWTDPELTMTREPLCTGCRNTNPPGSNTQSQSVSVGWIQCDACLAWWHEGCGGVTVTDYEGDRL